MPSAADYIRDELFHHRKANYLKNNFAGISQPTTPTAGSRWYNINSKLLKIYNGSDYEGISSPTDPFPVGTILGWNPGYFTDGSNGGFTAVLSANTIAGANGYLNSRGWWVCDGNAVYDLDSPIWNASERYLPNLTDDRFVQGSIAAGGTGGENTNSHLHKVNPPSDNFDSGAGIANADAGSYTVSNRADWHNHTIDIPEFDSEMPSVTDNQPRYLNVFYIIRVK